MSTHAFAALGYRLACMFKGKWPLLFAMLPAMFFLLILFLLKMADNLKPPSIPRGISEYEPQHPYDLPDKCKVMRPIGVSPDNAEVRRIMGRVTMMYYFKDVHFGPVIYKRDSEQLLKFFASNFSAISEEHRECSFGINFEELTLRRLSYTLRSLTSDGWNTSKMFPDDLAPRPMNSKDIYESSGFLGLQFSINLAYIEVFQHLIRPNIGFIQGLPYPAHREVSKQNNKQSRSSIVGSAALIMFFLANLGVLLIQEKSSGVREWLRTKGVRLWIIHTSWIFAFWCLTVISAIISTICWKYPLKTGAILPNSSAILLFTVILVYYLSVIASIGFISSLITSQRAGYLIIVVCLLVSESVVKIIVAACQNNVVLFFASVVPNVGLERIFLIIYNFEEVADGANFANLFELPEFAANDANPIGVELIFMIAGVFMNVALMEYIDVVKPGPYGRAKPWHFIFTFCSSTRGQPDVVNQSSEAGSPPRSIEQVENYKPFGLQVVNLIKVFGLVKAVDNLSMTIYKNEITALLGHNGAGKSTLFNIMCGMYSPTSGNIYTDEYDIFSGSKLKLFRKNLGYCPQHDLLMSYLTCQEHMVFFGILSGMRVADAHKSCEYWTKKFNIYDSRHKLVAKLSGGMKRKLCMSIALLGDPRYLLLDEPTSGLDPESRRDVWDVLLSLRGQKTIIISTHNMEEADILGDRVAIISAGKLKCYGTPMFLKQHFGFGYQLKILSRKGDTSVLNLIQDFVPSARLLNRNDEFITVGLPSKDLKKFPDLFRELSVRYREKEYSLSCTNMDDVFLKVLEDEGVKSTVDDLDMPTLSKETQERRAEKSSAALAWQQFSAMLKKRLSYTLHDWLSIIFFVILVPIIGMSMTSLAPSPGPDRIEIRNLSLDFSAYKDSVVLRVEEEDPDSETLKKYGTYASIINASGSTIRVIPSAGSTSKAILSFAEEDLPYYRSKVIAAFDPEIMLYSKLAYHAAPVVVGEILNAFLLRFNVSARISTHNFPYFFARDKINCDQFTINIVWVLFLWIQYACFLMSGVSYLVMLPHTERVLGFKHLQIMTGAQPILYWTSYLIVDIALYLIAITGSLTISSLIDKYDLFASSAVLGAIILVHLLFGIAYITFCYLCSYVAKTSSSAGTFCILVSITAALASMVGSFFNATAWFPYVLGIIPFVPFTRCLYKILLELLLVARCKVCNDLDDSEECEERFQEVIGTFFGIKTELIYMGVTPLVNMAFILFIDHGFASMIKAMILRQLYGKIADSNDMQNVNIDDEREAVAALRKHLDSSGSPPIFVCDGLGKKFSRRAVAVHDVTFFIRKSECFGLLGTNGAGKSTTFGMLTGSLTPTKGTARIFTYELPSRSYLKRLGYCPQLGGLLPNFSARSHLLLFGRLRGIPERELPDIIQKWIVALDMTQISNRPSKGYSGGNLKKLSTAIALIGDPPVTLLDEPTTGVDPVVRRKIWSILKYCREMNDQTIIFTSHSMDECEATCERLTIMVNGHMKCIGTIPDLKNAYGHGFVLLVKLVYSCTEEESQHVQEQVEKSFTPYIRLVDHQNGLFNYHIESKKVKLHKVFRIMINLKDTLPMIEDFAASNISLEQIFISLAKAG